MFINQVLNVTARKVPQSGNVRAIGRKLNLAISREIQTAMKGVLDTDLPHAVGHPCV